jgi:predicted ATPase/DNA-binding SARP family transcriptional activator
MPRLELSLLGGFQARLSGATITAFRSDKVRAMLAYLAVENDHAGESGRDHRREGLAVLFWPESDESSARANLRMALSNLRQLLAPAATEELTLLESDRRAVRLNRSHPHLWLDVACFDTWLGQRAAHNHADAGYCPACVPWLEHALALYHGDFLAGLTLPDSPGFEEWRVMQQETRHQQALAGLQALSRHCLETGAYEQAQRYARRQLALEIWQEAAHRQLMQALARAGRRQAALAQYEACRQALAEELGVEPTAETVALYEAIQAGTLDPGSTPLEGAPRSVEQDDRSGSGHQPDAALTPHNLPPQVTPFVGRDEEVADVRRRLLEPGYRLVTVTGVGGMGKTRLALTVAERVRSYFGDGVWFVPLTGVAEAPAGEESAPADDEPSSQANQLATAVAAALDITFHGAVEPRQQLLKQLQTKRLLLLLDNLESLLADEWLDQTADFILDLIRQAPGVTLLVTSRRRLNLQAEYALTLDGLDVPAAGAGPEAIAESASVRLFVERAERALGRLEPGAEDWARIGDICRLAAGLPLAIELAATWTPHYTTAEIVQAMRRNLDFLSTRLRDLPARHRSMGAVFEGSWQFLAPKEQMALARLSIFHGAFSRDAALEVTQAGLRDLSSLVNKSLLRRTAAGRYELHALLRQFASEKWAEMATLPAGREAAVADEAGAASAGSREGLRRRHSDYYLAFIEARAEAINSSRSHQILVEIRQELDNVRRAWQWAVAHGRFAALEESCRGLQRFYDFTGLFQEGESLFRTAVAQLEAQPATPPRLLGRLLVEQAYLLSKQGHFEPAITVAERAVALAGQAGDTETEVYARARLGFACWRRGREAECLTQLEQALQLAKVAGLRLLEAFVLSRFSLMALSARDYERAGAYFEQYLVASQKYGDREGEGITYNNLGYIYHARYDYGRARDYFEKALAIKQEMGTRQGEGNVSINLGVIYLTAGAYDKAQAHYCRALQIARGIGDQRLEGLALSNMSLWHVHRGDYEEACDHARQAAALMRRLGDRLTLAYPLTHLGYALTSLAEWQPAEQVLQEAVALRREVGQLESLLESGAGLAQLYLARGDVAAALKTIEPVVSRLQEELPAGIFEPFRVYLTAVEILQAAGDGRQRAFLAVAQEKLNVLANRFTDDRLRRSYLEGVAIHRRLSALV